MEWLHVLVLVVVFATLLLLGVPVAFAIGIGTVITMLLGMAPFSGIDVGVNRGGPVHWEVSQRHGSFRFSGRLVAVTYTPGEHAAYDPELVAEVTEDVAEFYD